MARHRTIALCFACLAAIAAPGSDARAAAALAVSFESEPACPAAEDIVAALRRELGAGNVSQGEEAGPSLLVRPLGPGRLEIVLSDPRRSQTRRVLEAPSGECGDLAMTVALLAAAWMRQPPERPFEVTAPGEPQRPGGPTRKPGGPSKSVAAIKPPPLRDPKRSAAGAPAATQAKGSYPKTSAQPAANAAASAGAPVDAQGPVEPNAPTPTTPNPPASEGPIRAAAGGPAPSSPSPAIAAEVRSPAQAAVPAAVPSPEPPNLASVSAPAPEPAPEVGRVRLELALFGTGFASDEAQERGLGAVAQVGLELSPRWTVGLAGGVDAPVSGEAAGGTVSASGRRIGGFARLGLPLVGAARLHLALEPFVTWISTESRGFVVNDQKTISDFGLAVSALWEQPVHGPVSVLVGVGASVRTSRDALAVAEVGRVLTLSPVRATGLAGVACDIF